MEENRKGILIGVANQKGGVGKTTTSSNIIAELSRRGYKVLGVDTDSQGNLSSFFGVNTKNKDTILELLQDEASFRDVLVKTAYCDIIPSDRALANYLLVFAQNPNFYFIFKNLFRKIASLYDYVVFDCAPKVDQITAGVLSTIDYLIIPTEPGVFSLQGMNEMRITLKHVWGERGTNPKLKVLGLLMVRYSARLLLSQATEEALNQGVDAFKTKIFDTKISDSSDVGKSQLVNKSLFDFKPKSKVAQEYVALVDEILREIDKEGK